MENKTLLDIYDELTLYEKLLVVDCNLLSDPEGFVNSHRDHIYTLDDFTTYCQHAISSHVGLLSAVIDDLKDYLSENK